MLREALHPLVVEVIASVDVDSECIPIRGNVPNSLLSLFVSVYQSIAC